VIRISVDEVFTFSEDTTLDVLYDSLGAELLVVLLTLGALAVELAARGAGGPHFGWEKVVMF